MKTRLIRQGYTQKPNGYFVKRVEFDVPKKPGVILVKILTRDPNGVLVRGERSKWMREKITIDPVKQH